MRFWLGGVAVAAISVMLLATALTVAALSFRPTQGDMLLVSVTNPARCNNFDLLLIDVRRGAHIVLTPDTCTLNFGAVWSPDGGRYVYTKTGGGNINLYISAFGHDTRAITRSHSRVNTLTVGAWSPDGERIAYYESSGNQQLVYTYNVRTDENSLHTDPVFTSRVGHQAWSPDGGQFLIRMSRDGRDFRMGIVDVTMETGVSLLPDAQVDESAWSPVADQIAYSAQTPRRPEVFITSVQDPQPENISNSNFVDRLPVWSPDGARVAYLSNRDGAWRIFIYERDTAETRQLTDIAATFQHVPAWSPDGGRVAFVSERRLMIANVETGAYMPLDLGDFRISETFTSFSFRP